MNPSPNPQPNVLWRRRQIALANRQFISTGVRSFQAGHVGGSVCGSDCVPEDFPAGADIVDACEKTGYTEGPVLPIGGTATGCPVWIRPQGDRYLVALLDETRRSIQVAMIHPRNVPPSLASWLPSLPNKLGRSAIDQLIDLRLPSGGG